MALFDKKICENCGNECNLIGGKLKLIDERFLCKSCYKKAIYGIDFIFDKYDLGKLTYNEYLQFLEYRKRNLDKIKNFNATRTFFGGRVLIDVEKHQIIVRDSFMINKNIFEENPEVIEMSDIVIADLLYTVKHNTESVFDSFKADVRLVLAGRSPYFDAWSTWDVMSGYKMKESGIFSTKLNRIEEVEEFNQCFILASGIIPRETWKFDIKSEDYTTQQIQRGLYGTEEAIKLKIALKRRFIYSSEDIEAEFACITDRKERKEMKKRLGWD